VVQIKVNVDLGGVLGALDQLHADVRERAAASAINKTLAKGNTRMAREISREFNISQAKVKDRLDISRAKFIGGKAVIAGALLATKDGKHRSMNLIAFVENKVTLAEAKRRAKAGDLSQLRFQIKRKGKAVVIPGAFIGNKGRTVFIREGKARLPIKALQTIDVPQMFNTRRINKLVVDQMEQDFPTIFDNDVKYFTDKFSRRTR
jgi:hypothetical protein